MKLFSLLFDRRVHKNGIEPAQVCASAILISTTAKNKVFTNHHAVLPYPTMHNLTCTARLLAFCLYTLELNIHVERAIDRVRHLRKSELPPFH